MRLSRALFSRWLMYITPCDSQKTVALTFQADRKVFAIFKADLLGEVYCFDCTLAFDVC